MARTKSMKTIVAKIEKTKRSMQVAKRRYDQLAEELKELNRELEQMRAMELAAALKESNKTWEELMTFLSK